MTRIVRLWAPALLLCILSGSALSAGNEPPRIVGLSTQTADVGDIVDVTLLEPVDSIASYFATVSGISVTPRAGSNTRQLAIDLPTSLIPGSTVEIVVGNKAGASKPIPLELRPLRIERVEPTSASAGDDIVLTVSLPHPLLADAQVSFKAREAIYPGVSSTKGAPDEAVLMSGVVVPVKAVDGKRITVVVPRTTTSLSSPTLQLAIVLDGKFSLPFDGFTMQSSTERFLRSRIVQLGMSAFVLVPMLYWFWLKARSGREPLVQTIGPAPAEAAAAREQIGPLPPLQVPPEVVRACLSGECVLYAGAGLAARAGLPTWWSFVSMLLDWSREAGYIDSRFATQLEAALQHGSVDKAADSIVQAVLQGGGRDALNEHVREIFTRDLPLPEVHRLIPDIGFSALLTTNFDNFLEAGFARRSKKLEVLIPADVEGLRAALAQRRLFLLRLYGDLSRPQSLVISPAQYEEKIQSDRPFGDFIQQLFATKTILFVGASLGGIDAYLRGLQLRSSPTVRHYAVVVVNRAGWEADAYALESRYGIKVLPYAGGGDHREVGSFIKELHAEVAAASSRGDVAAASAPAAATGALIDRLELRNVGAFEHLDIAFGPQWTILLGDNGVGKSTILKSIALAVAGAHASTGAGRLLKRPAADEIVQAAEITVTGKERYVTTIALNSVGQPEVPQGTPRALGPGTLVLAFPAIRTINSSPTRGPQLKEGVQSPNADDVLPILAGMPDPRILDLKQWVVDLDYLRRREPNQTARVDAIFETFLGKVRHLFGDTRFGAFDVAENNVFVQTPDGRLPIDALSQGTVSLLGWVGVLTQRLIEVTGSADSPALVLIDEIDAHMHPEWQQAIVSKLREPDGFPNVQFIVSTHSPFLAVGRQPGEIIRVRRNPATQKVGAEGFDRDTSLMTVSDVLTSQLFGLQSQLDHDRQKDLLRLRRLSVQSELSTAEKTELADVQARLKGLGTASAYADPLYGRFVDELRKARDDASIGRTPQTKEEDEQQRRETERILAELAREEAREEGTARS